ncbi:MAG: hypothetical protein ABIH42_00695 [Planctomycetota bacterium]
MKKVLTFALIAITALWLSVAYAQDAKQKLLARRAAELDAYRKLAEIIKGFQISSKTTVYDFVCESDEINTAFRTMLKGAQMVGEPRYFDDGSCEVDMTITLERVVTELKTIVKRYYQGDKYTDVVFEDIKKYVEQKELTVTGSGVARENISDEFISRNPSRKNAWSGVSAWENVSARDRLLAERAATVDAYRKLAEYIYGLQISGETRVNDFVAESDKIKTSFEHFLKGVQTTNKVYRDDGIVEVEVEVTLERVITELSTIKKRIYEGSKFKDVVFEDVKKYTERKLVKAIGEAVSGGKYPKKNTKPPVQKSEVPDWAKQVLKAKGQGIPPEEADSEEQARLLAERAAEIDAKRKLAEMINGVQIDSKTTVKDFVTQSDEIKAVVKTFVGGCKVVGVRTLEDGITVEVEVELNLEGLYLLLNKYGK